MPATAGTLSLAGASNLQGESQAGGSDQRPNILMVQADQLTSDVLGCCGRPVSHSKHRSPRCEGALFTDATCATPFCSPTRASILTGRYAHSHGIVTGAGRRLLHRTESNGDPAERNKERFPRPRLDPFHFATSFWSMANGAQQR